MTATALIADDDKAFRDLLRRAIEGLVRVVAEAESDDEAVSLAGDLAPHVIFVDLDLPKTGGIETMRRIKDDLPWALLILMTSHGEEAYLESTGRSGADGFLRKQSARTEAPLVLRRLAGGSLRLAAKPLRPWERSTRRRG